jgi:hypothetical protein
MPLGCHPGTHLELWEGPAHEVPINHGQPHPAADDERLDAVPAAHLTSHHGHQLPAMLAAGHRAEQNRIGMKGRSLCLP